MSTNRNPGFFNTFDAPTQGLILIHIYLPHPWWGGGGDSFWHNPGTILYNWDIPNADLELKHFHLSILIFYLHMSFILKTLVLFFGGGA